MQRARFKFVINLTIAKAPGLESADRLFGLADEVMS